MRILVTGAAGQLGTELVAALDEPHREVVAPSSRTLDLRDRDAVLGAVTGLQPDVVINAAAWTDVDGCEDDPDRAYASNALAVRHLADGCRRIGAHLVQISTDYVFDGTAGRPYVEWDACNPLSVYGRSKHGGEQEAGPDATVVRTSWVFGRHGSNVVKTILRLAAQPGQLRFVDDQHGCPTSADDLAAVVAHLALARAPGVFHVSNSGPTTRFEMARDILRFAGEDPERVVPIASSELAQRAPRPASSVLDNAALRLSGIPPLADHREPLERLVKELTTQ